MTRRRFAFWVGFGLFSLSEKFRAGTLDTLAAATMRRSETAKSVARSGGEHWAVGGDKKWWWFERENFVNGDWWLTGITTPVSKETGERKAENIGYIDDSLVPEDVRSSEATKVALVSFQQPAGEQTAGVEHADHEHEHAHESPKVDLDKQLPSAKVRGRHGRPPSKWLRSLNADELRIWLKTVKTPDAGVSGMTVFMHLTRDHAFDEKNVEDLTEKEQNKLHAAAHFGY
jgi:hypothetical protein